MLQACLSCVENISAAGFKARTVSNSALNLYDDYCASVHFGSGPSINQFSSAGAKLNKQTGFPITIPNGTSYGNKELEARNFQCSSSASWDSTTTVTSTVISKSIIVVAHSASTITSSAADASGFAAFTSTAVLSSNGLTNIAKAISPDCTEGKDTTSGIIIPVSYTTSTDLTTSSDLAIRWGTFRVSIRIVTC
jgi:hypothetical protein